MYDGILDKDMGKSKLESAYPLIKIWFYFYLTAGDFDWARIKIQDFGNSTTPLSGKKYIFLSADFAVDEHPIIQQLMFDVAATLIGPNVRLSSLFISKI